MWPREVFHRFAEEKKDVPNERKRGAKPLYKEIDLLTKPGVYVLYRDTVPYYVGQAQKLRIRLGEHACLPGSRYYNFWNFFSAFVVEEQKHRNEIEAILIASMPTANSAKPRIKRESLPAGVKKMVREIEQKRANPRFN